VVRDLRYIDPRRNKTDERSEKVNLQVLEKTAGELVAPGKGILAADESFGTIGKRFKAVGIESSEESRRRYREMLFTTEGIGEFLSGVILFDETIRQEASDGTPLPKVLENQGVIPGIKVDKSTVNLPLSRGVQGAWRALHQVAGGHHHRRWHPHRELHRGQRRGARPLRGVRPGV
jgi:Fructose-bisphosphate aldolase class-I